MALPVNGSTHLIAALLLIYRPIKDERLSWPSWLTCSGWFTHISGHPSAAGRAQDRESSPVRERRSTTVLSHQLMYWRHFHANCPPSFRNRRTSLYILSATSRYHMSDSPNSLTLRSDYMCFFHLLRCQFCLFCHIIIECCSLVCHEKSGCIFNISQFN